VLCLLPGLWALAARPPLPLDELRYLTVAWEMWLHGDFLVPHLDGLPYSHKPPLLFWLMHAGWALFGVNEWWPRMISPLCTLAAGALTVRLGRALWPANERPAIWAPWLLAGSVGWLLLGQMLMFDTLLAVFVLIGLIGLWRAAQPGGGPGFALIAAAIAGGILTKGPVALIHVLVPGLVAPWWAPRLRTRRLRWYGLLLASGLAGLLAAGLWALPAASAGGSEYARAILWGQTAGRIEHSFAHARPWYSYGLFLPVMLLPWWLWPMLWRSGSAGSVAEPGTRFLIGSAVSVTLVLSLLSAKQPHYALPIVSVFVLLMARRLAGTTALRTPMVLAAATAALLLTAASAFFALRGEGLDLRRPALAIAQLQREAQEVAILSSYKGQFGFLGRLEQPIPVVPGDRVADWAATHGGAYLVAIDTHAADGLGLEHYADFPYRGVHMDIWRVPADSAPGKPQ